MGLTPGTRLGLYEIVSPLGEGGMGEVYRGRDATLNARARGRTHGHRRRRDPRRGRGRLIELESCIAAPQEHRLYRDPANTTIAPDSTKIAFITGASPSDAKLWIRALDRLDAVAVEDSAGAQLPFWSPDSAMVGFFAGGHFNWREAMGR